MTIWRNYLAWRGAYGAGKPGWTSAVFNGTEKAFPEKTIWCFSGYDFEKDILGRMMQESEVTRELVPLLMFWWTGNLWKT